MEAVFFGVVILQFLASVLSYPSGAPASTCVDMMPKHGGVQPMPKPVPYTILSSSTTFQPGKAITGIFEDQGEREIMMKQPISVLFTGHPDLKLWHVESQRNTLKYIVHICGRQVVGVVIKGPDYTGVLLEARSGSDSKAIGTWQTPPTNTKFLTCSGNQQGAITHSNINIKNNSTVYTWIPPATANNVFFKATVAQERTVFWVDVMSSTLTSSGGTSLDVHSSAERIVTPALLLLVVLLAIVQYLVA